MTNLRKLFIPFSFCCGVLWSSNGADAAIIVNVQDKTITAGSTSNFVDVFIRSSDGTDTLDFANYDFAISLVSGSSTLQFSGTQNALQTGLPNYVFAGDAGPVTEVTLNNSQYAANAGTISFNGVSLTTSPNTALLARLEIDSVLGLLTPAQANGNQFRISLVNSGNTLFLDENGATLGIDPSSFSLANSGLITIQSSAAVPEPSTFAVIAMTLGGLGVLRRRKNQKAEAV